MHGASSFTLPSSGPAVTRFPCVVDHAGAEQAARPTFESLRFISQAPDGPAVKTFREWVAGSAKGKSLRERVTGKPPEPSTAQRAYLVGLRTLLNAEAPTTLLQRFTSADRHKALLAFLDQSGGPHAHAFDSKAGPVELSLQAGDVLFQLQTQAQKAFDDAVRAGRDKPIKEDQQALVVYAAINIALDDPTCFAERHQVRTASPVPEVAPEARRMVLGSYRSAVEQALKKGQALTPTLLKQLAAEATRELLVDFRPSAGGSVEAPAAEVSPPAMTTLQYAVQAFLQEVDAHAPQRAMNGTTQLRGEKWVFTEGFKQRQLGEFRKSLADFMQETDANAGYGLADARLAVFLEQIMDD